MEKSKYFPKMRAKYPNILPPIFMGDEQEIKSFTNKYKQDFRKNHMNIYQFNKYL